MSNVSKGKMVQVTLECRGKKLGFAIAREFPYKTPLEYVGEIFKEQYERLDKIVTELEKSAPLEN